jgi:adenylate cyclase
VLEKPHFGRMQPPLPGADAASDLTTAPLSATDRAAVDDLARWLVEEGSRAANIGVLWQRYCDRLVQLGVPLARTATQVRALHALRAGVQRLWQRGHMVTERHWIYTNDQSKYASSPIKAIHETGRPLRRRITGDTAGEFEIFEELRASGMTDYLALPMRFAKGGINAVTYATDAAEGFSDRALTLMLTLNEPLRVVLELLSLYRITDEVLTTYVGRGPAERILSGQVRRGDLARVNAAILMSDMRDFTLLSDLNDDEDTIKLLNAYYDCLIPPIQDAGGEVLKFIGDGVLAVFPEDENARYLSPPLAALRAARRAMAGFGRYNASHDVANLPMRVGISLHWGEVGYGNVGSGERLDFTVIGRDVNTASRIADMCKTLGQPILMSQSFVDRLDRPQTDLGAHELRGLNVPQRLYGVA